MSERRPVRIGYGLIAGAIVAALIAALVVLPIRRWWNQRDELADRQNELQILQEANGQLQQSVNALNTPTGIEEQARRDLNLSFPGEDRVGIVGSEPDPAGPARRLPVHAGQQHPRRGRRSLPKRPRRQRRRRRLHRAPNGSRRRRSAPTSRRWSCPSPRTPPRRTRRCRRTRRPPRPPSPTRQRSRSSPRNRRSGPPTRRSDPADGRRQVVEQGVADPGPRRVQRRLDPHDPLGLVEPATAHRQARP